VRGRLGLVLPLLLVAASGVAGAADLIPLAVEPARSSVVVITDRKGVLGFLRHAVLATEWSAEIAVSDDLTQGRVEVRIPVRGLRIDTPEAISQAGLSSRPDEETIRKLQVKMLSPTVLDAERYPTIDFHGQVLEVMGAERVRVGGPLRLHGRENPLTVELAVGRPGPGLYRFSGRLQLRQTAFGIEPESVAGVVQVADPVTVRLDLVARRKDGS
jgi:polyisoprenoid-binding protein YceI